MATAFVLVNAELGEEGRVLKELRSMSEITEAHIVYGVYDIIAKIEAKTMDELKEVVSSKIRKLGSIRSTLTLNAVEGV